MHLEKKQQPRRNKNTTITTITTTTTTTTTKRICSYFLATHQSYAKLLLRESTFSFPLMDAELSSYHVVKSTGTVVHQYHSSMANSKGKLTSIGNFTTCLQQTCLPEQVMELTVLSMNKVSDTPYNAKGEGQDEKGIIERNFEKTEPLYLGYNTIMPFCTENSERYYIPFDVKSNYAKNFISMDLAAAPTAPAAPAESLTTLTFLPATPATGLAASVLPATGATTSPPTRQSAAPVTSHAASRQPSFIQDSRFEKDRSLLAVQCDECLEWCCGNAQGTFWHTLDMPPPELRRKRWPRGEWNASWYCMLCCADFWDVEPKQAMELLILRKQYQ